MLGCCENRFIFIDIFKRMTLFLTLKEELAFSSLYRDRVGAGQKVIAGVCRDDFQEEAFLFAD